MQDEQASGRKGRLDGKARAKALTLKQRTAIAKKALRQDGKNNQVNY
jgi:hypothetical protein